MLDRYSWSVCLLLIVLTAGGVASAQQSDVTIRVANYGGVFTASQKKYVADLLTERTGIKVEYIDGNTVDHLAKLIVSKGHDAPFDVVYLDDNVQEQAIRAGVVEHIDPAIVTNLEKLYDVARNKDNYGPAMLFYSVGLAYNVDKFKAANIPEPTSWADLWDPRLSGHVAVPDISIAMGRDFLVAAARLNGGDESNIDKGIEKLESLKAHSYPNSSATIEAAMKSGEVWAVPWVNGRAWGLIDQGLPIRFIMPTEGGFGHTSTIDLVRGSRHPKEAQAYINLALDPLPQLGQANEIPYGPTNKTLARVLSEYPDLAKKFPASAEDLSKLYLINWAVFNKNYQRIVDQWNRRILSR
jgi:putative spermidine/putrescine transport system substrate-binding protein